MIDELRAESRHRSASRPRRELAVIEVPSALGRHPSGVADAPDALREAGLHRLLELTEVIRVDVPPYSSARDAKTHMLNPEGISMLAMRVVEMPFSELSTLLTADGRPASATTPTRQDIPTFARDTPRYSLTLSTATGRSDG